MADYKESGLDGIQWQRCKTAVINNPLNKEKSIYFEEERVISIGGQELKQPVGGCGVKFLINGSFPILDTSTNQPTGVLMTHNELYVALYSLYMQTALERDAKLLT